MANFFTRLLGIDSYIEKEITRGVSLAIRETEDTITIGSQMTSDIYRNRLDWDRKTVISEILKAWRTNPIARRLVEITNEFVVGNGFSFEIKDKATEKFLKDFWNDPLNNLDEQIPEWVDEQTRSGDLFILFTVVKNAVFPYVRALPAEQIKEIKTANNDYRQELEYIPQDPTDDRNYPAYKKGSEQKHFIRHYVINRPVGSTFGESDLAPILKWLGRLSTLLADRVIINHLRNLIVYIVTGSYSNSVDRKKRELELNTNPPASGSIIVKDKTEDWDTLSPKLDSSNAEKDILAVKKMIAAGYGVPLHYLAEPESATRTTAEAAGTPTFQKFANRQNNFKKIILDILTIACEVQPNKKISSKTPIIIHADDITERDNSNLALAAARIEPVLGDLFDREMIDEPTYLALFYTMLGMDYDISGKQPKGKRRPLTNKPINPPGVRPEDDETEGAEGA